MKEAELFDGTVLEFPDDTPDEVIFRVVRQETLARQPKQELVGFGERGQREQEMPLNDEAKQELAVAKTMARDRDSFGADDVFLQNYTFGLRDEARAMGAGLGQALSEGA
jgi:hypothetical protein